MSLEFILVMVTGVIFALAGFMGLILKSKPEDKVKEQILSYIFILSGLIILNMFVVGHEILLKLNEILTLLN